MDTFVDIIACESACPQEAIFFEEDLPAKWSAFTESGRAFFADLGSPGGASRVGKIHQDHPIVAGLPRQR